MEDAPTPRNVTALTVFVAFLRQGLTAFGGPTAHLAYFRAEFVERRRWLSEAAFADLLALCHVLPGQASSQLGIAIGLRMAGVSGALAAFAGFTLPAAVAMIALARLAPLLTVHLGPGWLHGLQVAAAAVVAGRSRSRRFFTAGTIRAARRLCQLRARKFVEQAIGPRQHCRIARPQSGRAAAAIDHREPVTVFR